MVERCERVACRATSAMAAPLQSSARWWGCGSHAASSAGRCRARGGLATVAGTSARHPRVPGAEGLAGGRPTWCAGCAVAATVRWAKPPDTEPLAGRLTCGGARWDELPRCRWRPRWWGRPGRIGAGTWWACGRVASGGLPPPPTSTDPRLAAAVVGPTRASATAGVSRPGSVPVSPPAHQPAPMSWASRQGLLAAVALVVGLWQVHRLNTMLADPRHGGAAAAAGRTGDAAAAHEEWLALPGGGGASAAWVTARTVLTRVAREPGWSVVESVTPPWVGARDHLQRRPARRLSLVSMVGGADGVGVGGDGGMTPLDAATVPLLQLIPHEGPLPQHQLPLRHSGWRDGAHHRGSGGHQRSAGGGLFGAVRSMVGGIMPSGAMTGSSRGRQSGASGDVHGRNGGGPQPAPPPQLQFDAVVPMKLLCGPGSSSGVSVSDAGAAALGRVCGPAAEPSMVRWWRDGYGCMMSQARAAAKPPSHRGPGAATTRRHGPDATSAAPWDAQQRHVQAVHGRVVAAPLQCECDAAAGGSGATSDTAAPPVVCWSAVWQALPEALRQALQALHTQGLLAQVLVPSWELAAAPATPGVATGSGLAGDDGTGGGAPVAAVVSGAVAAAEGGTGARSDSGGIGEDGEVGGVGGHGGVHQRGLLPPQVVTVAADVAAAGTAALTPPASVVAVSVDGEVHGA